MGSTIALVFFAAVSFVIRTSWVDSEFKKRTELEVPAGALVSPGRALLHAVSLEHRLAFADLAWLDVVQAIGASAVAEKTNWDRVFATSNIATDLDPKFLTVYDAGATVLAVWGRRVDEANILLEKGHRELPGQWRLPFLLGYNAFFLRGDAGRGADWLERASQIPGGPSYLAALAGRMRFFGGESARALAFLEQMIQNLSGPARRDAEWRLAALRSEPRLRRFDAACAAFRARRGSAPGSGSELVGAGFIREAPFDAFGKAIALTPECVAFTAEIAPEGRSTAERARALHGGRPRGAGEDRLVGGETP